MTVIAMKGYWYGLGGEVRECDLTNLILIIRYTQILLETCDTGVANV